MYHRGVSWINIRNQYRFQCLKNSIWYERSLIPQWLLLFYLLLLVFLSVRDTGDAEPQLVMDIYFKTPGQTGDVEQSRIAQRLLVPLVKWSNLNRYIKCQMLKVKRAQKWHTGISLPVFFSVLVLSGPVELYYSWPKDRSNSKFSFCISFIYFIQSN